MQDMRNKGISRDETKYLHFEKLIDQGILQKEGGLNGTELVNRAFIDRTVPFLPLEREHIKRCVVEYLRDKRGYPNPDKKPGQEFIEQVADEMTYLPEDTELFSRFGCRRVESIVNNLLP